MLLKNLSIRAFTKAKIGKIDVMCMSTVYLNSPPFKKRSTNSSHLNVSFLTLIIEGFFSNSGSSLNIFHSKIRIPKSILWDGG